MTPWEAGDVALDPLRGRITQQVDGLEKFAAILLATVVVWKEERKHALNAAAKLIKEDARSQIGHYQEAIGNYPAWAELAESTEDEKARLGAPSEAPLERFGDLKKSFRSTLVDENEVIVGSTDLVMEYHEFGTINMPPRPVLGPALLKNIDRIQKLLGVAMLDTVISGQHLGYRLDPKGGIGPLEAE